MRELRASTLQWVVGVFCAVMGALMVVAPHQFAAPHYAVLRQNLPWWGALFLLSGIALLSVAALAPSRTLMVVAHLCVGAALLMLGAGFMTAGAWTGTAMYTVLGLGTALAPLANRGAHRPIGSSGPDLFALLMGIAAALTGLTVLAFPEQLTAPHYDQIRPNLAWYGSAFLVGGAAMAMSQLRLSLPPWVGQVGHILTGAAFLAFFFGAMLPNRVWTGVALYGGFGLVVLALPCLRARLRPPDPRSLRTRLALVFAIAAALPLVAGTALDGDREERSATAEALAHQRTLAVTLAQDVADYIGFHRAALIALAAQPEFRGSSPDAQRAMLESYARAYPHVSAFSSFDPDGYTIARSVDLYLPSMAPSFYDQVRQAGGPVLDVRLGRSIERPIFLFGAPVVDARGELAGIVTASVESMRLTVVLNRATTGTGGLAYLVDSGGRALAHPDSSLVASFADLSDAPPVRALVSGDAPYGSLRYPTTSGEQLAGIARVPDLGWGVVVERPLSAALSIARAGREFAFGLVLLAIALAAVGGVLAAHLLASPLATLAGAVNELAAGNPGGALPRSRITEVAHLAAAFGELRDRLAGRTAERERAEEERSHLLERAQVARAEAEALAALTASVAGSVDPGETLAAAVETLPQLLGSSFCGIALPAADGVLAYEAVAGPQQDLLRQIRWQPGVGYVGRAFVEGRLMRSDDLMGDQARNQHGLAARLKTRAYLAAPLIAHGRTLGVVTAGSYRPGAFTRHHEELLMTVAQHVATALAAAQARAESRREAAQKAAILEQMADAVLVADANGRIVLANRAATSLYGLPVNEMLCLPPSSRPWRELRQDGSLLESPDSPFNRAVLGQATQAEYRVVAVDGAEHLVWVSAVPLRDDAGQVTGAVVVSRDITDERERQQQAAEGEKLRALGQMASGVAHDLNQYLGLVTGHADLGLKAIERSGEDGSDLQDSLTTILRAATDGAETVRRLVTFARPRQEGDAEQVDLGELLRDVAQLTAPRWRDSTQAQGRPISLHVEVRGDTRIRGWPSALREAVTNLVFNSVDALPNGGNIRLAAQERGDRVELEVSDSGLGMSPDVQARVFEPFFSTKGERGTGLGLSMVFGIVERHDGRLRFESAPGRGTTFRLDFPAAPAPDHELGAVSCTSTASPGRVLLVDDEIKLAQMCALMLEPDGHDLVLAASGEEALERLAENPFDLVISDVGMGAGMNGWELAAQVRERWPGTRFVLATGWGASIDPEESRARGVEAVLGKPYRLDALRQIVAEATPAPSSLELEASAPGGGADSKKSARRRLVYRAHQRAASATTTSVARLTIAPMRTDQGS